MRVIMIPVWKHPERIVPIAEKLQELANFATACFKRQTSEPPVAVQNEVAGIWVAMANQEPKELLEKLVAKAIERAYRLGDFVEEMKNDET